MENENRKEILTREVIKKELKEIYVYNSLIRILQFVAFCGALGLVYFLLINADKYLFDTSNYADIGKKIINIVCATITVVFVVFAIFLLRSICILVLRLVAICKNNFKIEIDKLVDKKEERRQGEYSIDEMELPEYRIPVVFNNVIHDYKRIYILNKLCFSRHKWFDIPEGKLYRWSDKYRMEHWAVYRWAEIGDEFYLITVKGKVLYVYNTKHFELKG